MAKKSTWSAEVTDTRLTGSRSSSQGPTVKVSDNTGKDVGTVKVVGSVGVRASKGGRKPEHGY